MIKLLKRKPLNVIPTKGRDVFNIVIDEITKHIENNELDIAIEELEDLIKSHPTNGEFHYLLGTALNKQRKWFLAYDSFNAAIDNGRKETVDIVDEFILASEMMEKYDTVIEILSRRKLTRKKLSKKHQYILSKAYLRNGDHKAAMREAKIAVKLADKKQPWQLAIKDEAWDDAIFYINKHIETKKKAKAWVYKDLAKASHMIMDFDAAISAIEKAIALEPTTGRYEMLAAIAEDKGDFAKALEAYSMFDIDKSKKREIYLYRIGYTNYCLGNFEQACKYWKELSKYSYTANNSLKSNIYYVQAIPLIESNPSRAIELLERAVQEITEHNPRLYAEIAYIYEAQGDYQQAAYYYKQLRVQEKRVGAFGKALKGAYARRLGLYAEMYEDSVLDENTILYSSLNGVNFSGNPLAIFKQMRENKNYHHYIAIDDNGYISNDLFMQDNVTIVKYNSHLHLKLLTTAKYIISDTTFLPFFVPKDGQKILNTWHGTPLKRIGLDIAVDSYFNTRNLTKAFRVATHVITHNQFMEDKIVESHTLDKYNQTKYKVTGYPRQDFLLNTSDERKAEIKSYLGIPADKQVIMYAPTFRGSGSEVDDRADEIMWAAAEQLREIPNAHLIYKPHHYSTGADSRLNRFDTNELLSIVDILISDYSSIAIDYLAIDRPVLHYVFDKAEYEQERGLYFGIDTISDYCFENLSDLVKCTKQLVAKPEIGPKQTAAKERFCNFDDGKCTERVIDFFFEDNTELETDNKRNLLFFAGNLSLTNGLTRSFENLVNKLSNDENKITIIVAEGTVKSDSSNEMLDRMYKLGHNIVVQFGRDVLTAKETYARNYSVNNREFHSLEMKEIHEQGYARNVKRTFGNQEFDAIINFGSGYTTTIHTLLTKVPAKKRVIVLHSDMQSEAKVRMPHLKQSFAFYNKYDHVLTVSQSVGNENMKNLAEKFDIAQEKFGVLNNIIDFDHILEMAEKPLEEKADEKYFNGSDKIFISVGRFSPEKNHELAIKSFQQVIKNKKYKDAKLLLMGHGPLEERTKSLVRHLRLQKNVIILGQRSNPYNYLKKSDCFLFPSLHEGQPLVLFEAMITDTPIIASNIPPNVEFIDKYGGVYTNNNLTEYTAAINDYLENGIEWKGEFSGEAYNQGIIDHLFNLLELN